MYRYMIKIDFFPLIIFLLVLETEQLFHRKSSLFILLHLDSYKQMQCSLQFFFFYNCTYILALAMLFHFSVQVVTKMKMHYWPINVIIIYMYSLFQGTENLKILFVATHSNFEVNNICQKNEQYCITECMPLHFFKPNTLNGDFKHQIFSTLLQTATLNNMYMNISRFSG